ncbi:MAG TPA: hypothetical protein O0X27_01115 [Methanocorpusculum sp.]|nr:hypothetical protein [Methanocorpusculum sp.]
MAVRGRYILAAAVLLVLCMIPAVAAESVWLDTADISGSVPDTSIVSQKNEGILPDGCFHTFTLAFPATRVEDINNVATVTFRIPESFLKEHGSDVTDVILYGRIQRDGKPFWDGKPTTDLDTENGYAVYEAGITASGEYAISFRKGAAIDANVIPTICYGDPISASAPVQTPVPIAGILAGIGAAVAVFTARKQ